MKIIHTADWHLGKLLGGVYLYEDQVYVLEEFYKLLQKERPDLIIVAGDIYDRSYPPVEAVRLLNECFKKILLDLKIPMVVITGNHDHSDRLDFGSELMESSGLYLRAKLEKDISPISFTDSFGEWEIYPIPYADTALVRSLYGESEIRDAETAMQRILGPINEKIRIRKKECQEKGKPCKRYIAVAHSFFVGKKVEDMEKLEKETLENEWSLPEESDSERPLSIGGVEHISVGLFSEFDYVALGHLHKPQKVERETIRYAGSLLKYSFSEANHQKSVVVLDWQEDLKIRLEQLQTKRNLRIIHGTLAEILSTGREDKARDDYIMVRLADKEIPVDPITDLKAIYPNILGLEYEEKSKGNSSKALQVGREFLEKNIWELFAEFYETVTDEKPDLTKLKKGDLMKGASDHETD